MIIFPQMYGWLQFMVKEIFIVKYVIFCVVCYKKTQCNSVIDTSSLRQLDFIFGVFAIFVNGTFLITSKPSHF